MDLRQSLTEVGSLMGDLYKRMIDALDEEPNRSALIIASHCMREICNNLPDVLADVEDLPAWQDNSAHTRLLAKLWNQHQLRFESSDAPQSIEATTEEAAQAFVTIPADVASAADVLVRAHAAGTTNSQQRRSALVVGTLHDGDHPSVRIVNQSLRFFMGYTHLRKGADFPLPPRNRVIEHLSYVEDVLLGRIGSFFNRLDDIEDLLRIANRQSAEFGSRE